MKRGTGAGTGATAMGDDKETEEVVEKGTVPQDTDEEGDVG
jgi:hypothetical protein